MLIFNAVGLQIRPSGVNTTGVRFWAALGRRFTHSQLCCRIHTSFFCREVTGGQGAGRGSSCGGLARGCPETPHGSPSRGGTNSHREARGESPSKHQ